MKTAKRTTATKPQSPNTKHLQAMQVRDQQGNRSRLYDTTKRGGLVLAKDALKTRLLNEFLIDAPSLSGRIYNWMTEEMSTASEDGKLAEQANEERAAKSFTETAELWEYARQTFLELSAVAMVDLLNDVADHVGRFHGEENSRVAVTDVSDTLRSMTLTDIMKHD